MDTNMYALVRKKPTGVNERTRLVALVAEKQHAEALRDEVAKDDHWSHLHESTDIDYEREVPEIDFLTVEDFKNDLAIVPVRIALDADEIDKVHSISVSC